MKSYPSFQTIKEQVSVTEFARAHLQRVAGGLVCPCCASGTGPSKTPAFSICRRANGVEGWKCYSCDEGGTVIDLAQKVCGFDSAIDAANYVAEWARVDPLSATTVRRFERPPEPEPDYSEARAEQAAYIRRYRTLEMLSRAEGYLASRGYTVEEAYSLGFGYNPNAGGAKDADGRWCRRGRLIIPWPGSDYYHIDRSTDPAAKVRKYDKPPRGKIGPQPVFNPAAVESDVLFVCEGALDALAVMGCGQQAIALGGTGYRDVVNFLRSKGYRGTAVLMLDNDPAGWAAQEKLYDALRAPSDEFGKRVDALMFNWYWAPLLAEPGNLESAYKDAGEAFERARADLTAALGHCAEAARESRRAPGRARAARSLDEGAGEVRRELGATVQKGNGITVQKANGIKR